MAVHLLFASASNDPPNVISEESLEALCLPRHLQRIQMLNAIYSTVTADGSHCCKIPVLAVLFSFT